MKNCFLFVVFILFLPVVIANTVPSVTPLKPGDGHVVNNPVTFTWSYFDADGDDLQYSILQIDDDRNFFSPINYRVDGMSFKTNIGIGGEYWWRVQVVNEFDSKLSSANRFFLNIQEKVCNDGTEYFECSITKPGYCDNGVLVNKCQKCGCESDGICQPDGSCLVRRCADGTTYGACTSNKPLYCFQGIVKEVCSLCGCPDGLECIADGSCVARREEVIIAEEIIIESPEKSNLTFLERIANFFKWLFVGKPLYK